MEKNLVAVLKLNAKAKYKPIFSSGLTISSYWCQENKCGGIGEKGAFKMELWYA